MIYTAIKRYNIDRKGLIVVYITVSILPLLAAMGRLIDEIFQHLSKHIDYISVSIMSVLLVLIIESIYLGLTHKGDENSKRLIIIGFVLVAISIIPLLILSQIIHTNR